MRLVSTWFQWKIRLDSFGDLCWPFRYYVQILCWITIALDISGSPPPPQSIKTPFIRPTLPPDIFSVRDYFPSCFRIQQLNLWLVPLKPFTIFTLKNLVIFHVPLNIMTFLQSQPNYEEKCLKIKSKKKCQKLSINQFKFMLTSAEIWDKK